MDVAAPGSYRVTLTLGDASEATDQVRISLEGVERETLSTAAGEIVRRTYEVEVSDARMRNQGTSAPSGRPE